ncbi:MAG: hypothetical protein ACOC8H_00645 [bacterium]
MLSSVGTSGPKPLSYAYAGAEREAKFSAFGLWKLLPESDRPNEILFLVTPQAKRAAWHDIENEAATLGITMAPIDLPSDSADDTRQFLEIAAEKIPSRCRLTLNVTEGLRHHAFLFYALQHHGMKPAVFEPHRKDILRVEEDWRGWTQWRSPQQFGGGHGKLLICPIGLTPGVLYSALKHTAPDRVLVICSAQSAANVEEACQHAGSQAPVSRLQMREIDRGVDEFDGLIAQASLWLFEADEIDANLTGGTTLMGVLVSRLVARAQREYQRPVRECVLIDPRTPEEQRNDPWRLGEIHYLDGEPNAPDSACDSSDDGCSTGEFRAPNERVIRDDEDYTP